MKTITITDEAANCLAAWANNSMYGPTISKAIVEQMREWMYRDGKDDEYTLSEYVAGEFDSLTAKQKR